MGLWAFDVDAGEWIRVQAECQPGDFGGSNHGVLTYDPVGDVLLWHKKGGSGIQIYDVTANQRCAAAPPPKVSWKSRQSHGFHDPDLNVHFYYLAGDGDPDGFMLCYRYNASQRR